MEDFISHYVPTEKTEKKVLFLQHRPPELVIDSTLFLKLYC